MTESELLVDFYLNAERQGPGSIRETLMALDLTGVPVERQLKIADIGCGTGGQTITLARNTEGHITAVDLFPEFLDKLNSRSEEPGLEKRIETIEKSMEDLAFADEEFDLIWSEGAIYNIGFEKGIREWRRYLKPGGCLAVSEITWITDSRPEEIEDYWTREYPEIDTASNKIRLLEENGYTPAGYFVLSQDSWVKNFYEPMENRFSSFLEKHDNSEMAQSIIEEHKEEIRLYREYKDYYSYGFYIAKKSPGR